MILYLTYWFPAEYRGRVISTLFIAQPVANAVASIASSAILSMNGMLGVKGWQWIFIIEAIPAVLLGLVILRIMTDRPASRRLAGRRREETGCRLGLRAKAARSRARAA